MNLCNSPLSLKATNSSTIFFVLLFLHVFNFMIACVALLSLEYICFGLFALLTYFFTFSGDPYCAKTSWNTSILILTIIIYLSKFFLCWHALIILLYFLTSCTTRALAFLIYLQNNLLRGCLWMKFFCKSSNYKWFTMEYSYLLR